jgi:hypothetical protein
LMRTPACLINIIGYCTFDQDGMPGYVLIYSHNPFGRSFITKASHELT